MNLNDLKNRLMKTFARRDGDSSRRPDGGTSCYRPIHRRNQPEIGEQEEPPMTYIHTGFTGMNPPASGFDTGFGAEGWNAYNPGNGFQQVQQNPYGQTAYSPQPAQNDYRQSPYNPAQPLYSQVPFGQPQQNSWESQPYQRDGRGRAEEPPVTAARPDRGWFPPREESVPRSNISYMPGYSPDAGAAPFNHVEHIMTLTGLRSCYEAIECMKNGETLIVTLDAIANENESTRCQDMLAGAAFTLGCSVRMLMGARLVLIAPEGVKVLPEEAPARMENVPPVPVYTNAVPQENIPRTRERRSGRNAAEWNAARSGQMEGYNPYTGTMPVAAGAYGNFGGYGY